MTDSTVTEKPLAGRLALVTGASRGIGRAIAKAYARAGAHVILLARSAGALEEADDEIRALGGTATLLALDLKKADKLDALGPTILQRWGHLDIFVANAGLLGPLSPLGHISTDSWREVLDVNLTANWHLIRALDPLLKRSAAGRAIFVTSGAAQAPNAYWGPYAVSKAGLEALAKTWARELDNTPVRVNIVSPGPVRTFMRTKAFPGEDATKLRTPDDVTDIFVRLASASCTDHAQLFDLRMAAAR